MPGSVKFFGRIGQTWLYKAAEQAVRILIIMSGVGEAYAAYQAGNAISGGVVAAGNMSANGKEWVQSASCSRYQQIIFMPISKVDSKLNFNQFNSLLTNCVQVCDLAPVQAQLHRGCQEAVQQVYVLLLPLSSQS